MATAATRLTIGPHDAGRAVPFDEFGRADFVGAHHLYELARGMVILTQVPGIHHGWIVSRVTEKFVIYDVNHRGRIIYRASGAECRVQVRRLRSDRHPDQAVYPTPPPQGNRIWERWVPAIVVEVVSRGGEDRDYVEKREEYLRFGIQEYWIFDPWKRTMLVLRRAGGIWEERELGDRESHQTELLPGLVVSVGEILGPWVEEDLDAADDLADDEIPPPG